MSRAARHFVEVLTGATHVTSIPASKYLEGDVITYVADAAGCVIEAGSNLKMPADWTSAAAGDAITFVCYDGTNWAESGRQRP